MDLLYKSFIKPGSMKISSWVPDWTTPVLPVDRPQWLDHTVDDSMYIAAGDTQPQVRTCANATELAVTGGLVDTISQVVSGPIINRNAGVFLAMHVNLAFIEADEMFAKLSAYPTGEPLSEVKWRTFIGNKTHISPTEAPPHYGKQYEVWREHLKGCYLANTAEQRLDMVAPTAVEYFQSVTAVSRYKLCVTEKGYVGLVPLDAVRGDQICVLYGAKLPFVLRRSAERKGRSQLVGGCYVHGMMKGEGMKLQGWREEEFVLH